MASFRYVITAIGCALWSLTAALTSPSFAQDANYRDRLPEDEVVYFVLPDRFENGDISNDQGGLEGGPSVHGFDTTHKGYYHGGDLKGLTARLDYIQGLGASAIWLGPIYKNKPVQGEGQWQSAGYHGYWITDFTQVDPHFGTAEDMKAFVDAAHARGMKVYLDIITNHTADVIKYRECHDPDYPADKKVAEGCPYRSKADYPWTKRGGTKGRSINKGFMGDSAPYQTTENFAKLTAPDYAYTPYVPDPEQGNKVPAWLNDLSLYHNRGDTTFEGENSVYGDFVGLDDLMTENPRVIEGFVEIFKDWISTYKIDGFRVDTAKHVNSEFWQGFIPPILEHAKAEGIPNFYVFAEATHFEPGALAGLAHHSGFPSALDFPLYGTLKQVLIEKQSPRLLQTLFEADILFPGGEATARALPTFTGNHDFGRFAGSVVAAMPEISDEELYKRVRLANALIFFARGVPVLYYGDEQGFAGDGGDQDAREDMFPSQTEVYNDNTLIKSTRTTAQENFDTGHALYRAIAKMAKQYHAHTSLRRGRHVTRLAEKEGEGLYVFSRIDEATGSEYLIALNMGKTERSVNVGVAAISNRWKSVEGRCDRKVSATGSYPIRVAPLDYIICRSGASD